MKRCYVVLVVLLAVGVSAQAAIVPNGDFAMYKPGTTIRAYHNNAEENFWAQGIGLDMTTTSSTPLDYDDGTTGNTLDCPGWVIATETSNAADLFTGGYDLTDGTSALNAFGGWGSGNTMVSENPLTVPALGAGEYYVLSAMVAGSGGPAVLQLLVGGVALTPDSQVDPTYKGNNGPQDPEDWEVMSRTYSIIPVGDVTVLVGIPEDADRFGARQMFDNIDLSVIPEPATMLLLGLGGLLLRRKR